MKENTMTTSTTDGFTGAGISSLAPALALAGGIAAALCQWLIFQYAPMEETMRMAQKIFYLHLPLAWWGLFSFFVVFIASIAYLKTRSQAWDALAQAAAEVGLLFAVLALIAGMLWAKPAWGRWWTGDARLTTTLIMCFVYAAYLIIRGMDLPPERRSLVTSVIGIAAFLDVPLVFISARKWSYIHPKSIQMEPEMLVTLVACVASFVLLWLPLLILRARLARDERRLDAMLKRRLLTEE